MVGLDRVTNTYHIADLGLNHPSGTFTNDYRRGEGLGIDLSVGEVVWVIRVDNGGGPSTPSEVAHTVGKVSRRIFSSGRSACKKQSMVADLVGQ